jgi:hypothetical protein
MPASLRMADARDIVRPTVARLLGRGSLKSATAAAQGLMLPEEVTAPMANAPYRDGVRPYLPLLPLITDRHVDAFTLAGTTDEVNALLGSAIAVPYRAARGRDRLRDRSPTAERRRADGRYDRPAGRDLARSGDNSNLTECS